MDALPATPHLRALQYAQQCVAFNARPKTIALLTGLEPKEVTRHFPPERLRCGRFPSSPEWYHTANLIHKAEASIVLANYRRIRSLGFSAQEALLTGFRRYVDVVAGDPAINFDRAFNLVCHLDGLWRVPERSFDLRTCPHCGRQYLIPIGETLPVEECVFCKLVARYPSDHRLQSRFPPRPLPDLTALRSALSVLAYLVDR